MKRLNVYYRKINYIVNKLSNLPKDLDNDIVLDAVLYRIHTSIESAMDIIAMLVKDLGLDVEDDYTNIETLEKKGIFDRELADILKRLNGLRNVIVHRYNKIEEQIIKENLDAITESLFKFVSVVENVLREIFR